MSAQLPHDPNPDIHPDLRNLFELTRQHLVRAGYDPSQAPQSVTHDFFQKAVRSPISWWSATTWLKLGISVLLLTLLVLVPLLLIPGVMYVWLPILLLGLVLLYPELKWAYQNYYLLLVLGPEGVKQKLEEWGAPKVDDWHERRLGHMRRERPLSSLALGLPSLVLLLPPSLVALGLSKRLRVNIEPGPLFNCCYAYCFLALGVGLSLHNHTVSAIAISLLVIMAFTFGFLLKFQRTKMGKFKGRIPLLYSIGKTIGLRHILLEGLTVIGGFACLDFAISQAEPSSFARQLSVVDAFYFSVITFSTVGYGDIFPASDVTKLVCIAEIFVGFFFYVVLMTTVLQVWYSTLAEDQQGNPAKSA